MANDKETLEEISTWIRVDFHEICPWQAHGGRCAGCPLGGAGNNCIFDKIADKVDAAAKRERTEIEADALAVGGIVEAARKGELSKIRPKNAADFGHFGNAAAMREALVIAKRAICHHAKYTCQSLAWENSTINANCGDILCAHRDLCEAKTAIHKALSAPARNCDVGTPETQVVRMSAFCRKHQPHGEITNCPSCPIKSGNYFLCALRWAQMPYEEGGAK